ncbi:hypothetical protein Tco_1103481 [Tanacetum coccineum]
MEVVWMRKFIDGLGDVMPSNKRPMEMLCDNAPAIAIANDPGIIKGANIFKENITKFVQVIQLVEIILNKVHTDDNLADPFMKPMSYNKHFQHVMAIGVCPASRKAHLLEDKQIPSVVVFDEVIWEAFGGKARDLGSIREEIGQEYNFSSFGDGVKTYPDAVRIALVMASPRSVTASH